jgi:class 3 adenylate cyclase/energy-coupling factor transporter ATP-binding protein EcfA2
MRLTHIRPLVFQPVPTCARCGQDNPELSKFCNSCGAPVGEPGRAGEERRIVSVLFVDLVGFTARSEVLDPEDVRAFLVPYYEAVRAEVGRFGGRVEKFIGDAVMGVFGAPIAYGDDSERAVRAAFAVREWAEREGMEIRIAVNTGEAIVELEARPEHGEAMVAGDVVNTAARLQAAAPVGAVLVGEETWTSTRGSIEYRPSQPVTAKGKEAPVRAWLALRATAAIGERPVAPVPMIGRERELNVLAGLWERVSDEGRAHFVTVFGPSGIGKSRIALELSQLIASQGGRVIRGRSTPYGSSSPYSAYGQQIKQIASIFDSDDDAEAESKLADAVAALAGPAAAEEHVPNLAALLGIGTHVDVADREQLFFSARVIVESLALQGPTMLLYEDIHWADASLLDLLSALAGRVRDVPVMFVALARPELLAERPGWGGGLPAYTALPLDPLPEESSRELAERLLEGWSDAETRAAAVAVTAEGNPLFIEELAASLAERSTANVSELPTSVRAIVAARLDSLPTEERSVLVDASVVGRVFWRGALEEITRRGDISELLGSLEARDLIQREAVSRIRGDQQYGFKHGLIHEVAYGTLPRAARRARHGAVARFLEASTAVGQSHDALGRHWSEAGEPDRAVEHLTAAGDQAGRGWAKSRAVALYREALELLPEGDERRKDITRRLAVALQAEFHLPEVEGRRPA